jgi:Cellobiose phosphorylase
MEYLMETADFSILDEVIPYYDQGADTVYQHLIKAIEYAISIRSLGDWYGFLMGIGMIPSTMSALLGKARPHGAVASSLISSPK